MTTLYPFRFPRRRMSASYPDNLKLRTKLHFLGSRLEEAAVAHRCAEPDDRDLTDEFASLRALKTDL